MKAILIAIPNLVVRIEKKFLLLLAKQTFQIIKSNKSQNLVKFLIL